MTYTVMIVEDDEDLLILYKTALGQKGHDLTLARTGSQALELLADEGFTPQLVFLDIEMPDAPGTRVVDYIRHHERLANTKIIVITANEAYRARIGDVVDEFVVKPVGITYLLNLADKLMS